MTVGPLSGHGVNTTIVGWVSSSNDRGTLDIIYSSSITIILCVWVSTYPNVPAPTDEWYHHLLDKFNLAMIGAAGPDLLFALAVGQCSSARESVRMFKAEWPDDPWTITHGFFADMGGFRLHSDQDDFGIPLNAVQLFYLIKQGHIRKPTVSDKEIKQMSSKDLFSKAIVMWQVFWFVVNILTRLSRGLPITTLEVTAFIFAVMMIATSLAWFQKPQVSIAISLYLAPGVSFNHLRKVAQETTHPDMQEWHETPLDFIWKRSTSFKANKHWEYLSYVSHKCRVPLFTRIPGKPWARIPSDIWRNPKGPIVWICLCLQVVFCFSFLWPWDFHFASTVEQNLWRACAVLHTFYSFIITVYYIFWLHASKLAHILKNASKTLALRTRAMTMTGRSASTLEKPLPPLPRFGRPISLDPEASETQEAPNSRCKRLDKWRNLSIDRDPDQEVKLRYIWPFWILTILYMLSHLYIYIEDFLALRSQPADVYRAPNQYFPLIR